MERTSPRYSGFYGTGIREAVLGLYRMILSLGLMPVLNMGEQKQGIKTEHSLDSVLHMFEEEQGPC